MKKCRCGKPIANNARIIPCDATAAERGQHGIYFEERFESLPGNCSLRLETHRKHFANGLRKIYTGARYELYLPRVRPDFRIPEADG
jgi:hypothetical protein